MDEVLGKGHAGEIDSGVSHTEVSGRCDTGWATKGKDLETKDNHPAPKGQRSSFSFCGS